MRLIAPFRAAVGMSGKDYEKPGQFISGPVNLAKPLGPMEARPYVRHQVPYVHQQHINLCRDSCAAMLPAFRGRPLPADLFRAAAAGGGQALAANPRGALEGISADEMVKDYPSPYWQQVKLPQNRAWAAEKLAFPLKHLGPIICSGDKHAVVLTEMHETNLYIYDPWRGANLCWTLGDFNRWLGWDRSKCMLCPSR